MPAKRELTMRQIRQTLRLASEGISARAMGRMLGVARSTIQDNLKRAQAAGPSCPHKAGTTAGSGQKARPRAGASMGAATPSLRAEAMPRLSPRVDAGSRRAGNPRYQHGHRRVAARRPPRAGAGPSSEALPTGGQGRGHTTGPGCRQRQAQRRRFAMASR
jgi:hypothetical protein